MVKQECHGHDNNIRCTKCVKYNHKSFSWDVCCVENRDMLNYKMAMQIKQKDKLSKLDKIVVQEEDRAVKSMDKKADLLFHHKDFFYDFTNGCQFMSKDKSYLVRVSNLDSGNELFSIQTSPGLNYYSPQKFYVRWGIKVYCNKRLFFKTELDLDNKNVLIDSKSSCVGDNFAWINSIDTFQRKHNCNITCVMPKHLVPVFSLNFPNINFLRKKDRKKYYAVYRLKCGNGLPRFETIVFDRIASLEKISDYILDVRDESVNKKFKVTETHNFGGDYVCYSERASSLMKEWHNPKAQKEVVEYLQSLGLLVVNIDQKPRLKNLEGVIYLNGRDKTIQDRINTLSGARFFMGMASGLAWVARACHVPAIVIGGFSLPISEFDNPYRLISTDFCFGCWNYVVNSGSCTNKIAPYICNKSITARQVIDKIDKIMEDEK